MSDVTTPAPTAQFAPQGKDTWERPWAMYEALRDHDPVHHVVPDDRPDEDYWVLSRFQDVFDAARDTETFSSAQGLTFQYNEREKIGLDEASPIVMMDPPDHTEFRRLVGKGFTPRRVSEFEPEVRDFVRARLAELGAEGDIIEGLFKPLPSFVVAHYLGVPPEDRLQFDGWTDSIVAANAGGNVLEAEAAVADLFGYFAALIERRRSEPADDPVSVLVQSELGHEDDVVLRILGFCFTMVTGGNDTTTGLLGGAAALLTAHPDQQRLLADEPHRIADAVEEFLRLTSPVQGLARMTTSDVVIGDTTIPAGRKVMLLYASANRDPREFGDTADQLDVTRDIDKIVAFSYGAHHCLGAAAARLQARVALEELLAAHPAFTVDAARAVWADGPFVRRYESLPFTAAA